MSSDTKARSWLRTNGYDDIADQIDAILEEWRVAGKKTRRNWWDITAGDKNGNARRVASRQFPVLRAAQLRQGRPVTKNAILRSRREKAPPVLVTGRWGSRN